VKTYYVYILASKSRTLYTGVTSNLERRVLSIEASCCQVSRHATVSTGSFITRRLAMSSRPSAARSRLGVEAE
jgi:predicted GIY-YIG superfamily endonuclease